MKDCKKRTEFTRNDKKISVELFLVEMGSKTWYTVEVKRGQQLCFIKSKIDKLTKADKVYNSQMDKVKKGDYDGPASQRPSLRK